MKYWFTNLFKSLLFLGGGAVALTPFLIVFYLCGLILWGYMMAGGA